MQKIAATAVEFLVGYSFQIVGAVLILIVGFFLARWLATLVFRIAATYKLDLTLSRFLAGFVKATVLVFAGLIALGTFGVTLSPLVAVLGAAALGTTYAVQAPLSNLGAGFTIIFGRPFSLGDTITVAGVSGVVEEIKLSCTLLETDEGVRVAVPNKHIVGEIIHNSGRCAVVEGEIGVSYDAEPEQALAVIRDTLASFPEVARAPVPQIGIQKFADSAVLIAFRYWTPPKQRFQVSSAVNLAVYKALQAAAIKIPFPQLDLHVSHLPQSS